MDFLLNEDFSLPKVGETRNGWVIEHRNNEILVDISAKSEGVITGDEIQMLDENDLERLAVGNEVTVFVVDTEDRHGNVIVSYAKAAAELDWVMAEKLMTEKKLFETTIIGQNKGGVLVKVGLLRGFVPNSQLSRLQRRNAKGEKQTPTHKVGQDMVAKVIEVDKERNRLILSERAADQERRQEHRKEILDNLNVGQEHEGRVINLADFGAFVDIGGIEGLVHLSEISWKRINHPSEVLQVGEKVRVAVLNIDTKRERLALSIKQLQPDPWSNIDDYYQVGQLAEAIITKLTKYGAFARLNDDYQLEGLIHISELSEDHINHPSDILKQSDKVAVRIIRIDPDQRQIGLSIKQVSSEKFVEADLALLTSIQE